MLPNRSRNHYSKSHHNKITIPYLQLISKYLNIKKMFKTNMKPFFLYLEYKRFRRIFGLDALSGLMLDIGSLKII